MRKTMRSALLALALTAGTIPAASAQLSIDAGLHIGPSGRASVDLGFFYDNLASYGNWIQRPQYGWVWTPGAVSTAWRPYEDGHWVWTDQGWTWITDEPYGWATYHYGRWYQDPEIGWAWVPGEEWGPAWVSWQGGDDYIGWAPLPPGADLGYDEGYGYDNGYGPGYEDRQAYDNGYGYGDGYPGGYGSYDYGIGPDAYVFVPARDFLSLSLASYVVPQVQVSVIFQRTHNYTHYRREGGRIYDQGIPVDRVQRAVGRSVTRYQISDLQARDYRQPRARVSGHQVEVFRPQVQRAVQVAPPASRPTARRAVVSTQQFQETHPTRAREAQARARQSGRYQQPGAQPSPRALPQGEIYRPRTLDTDPSRSVQPDRRYERPRQVNPQQDPGRYDGRSQPRYQPPQSQEDQQRRVNPQRYQDQGSSQRQRVASPRQDAQRPNRTYQRPPQEQQQRGKVQAKDQSKDRNRDQSDDQDRRPPAR